LHQKIKNKRYITFFIGILFLSCGSKKEIDVLCSGKEISDLSKVRLALNDLSKLNSFSRMNYSFASDEFNLYGFRNDSPIYLEDTKVVEIAKN
jgi:hypothetical protein